MQLMTKEIKQKLLRNNMPQNRDLDHKPVVKFFAPVGSATWLITEMDIADEDTLYGLCDLGMGSPELGYVSLKELKMQLFMGGALGIERDLNFTANRTISDYYNQALREKRIVA